jgi:hypothetical protein
MQKMRIAKLYTFIFLFIFLNRTNAQLNIMTGYVYGYSDIPVLNGIIDSFNAKTPTLSSSMSHVNSMHGLVLGLRYRLPHLSLEFSWANSFTQVNNRSTTGVTEVKNTLSFSSSTFSLGGDFYYRKVGFGGSFDLNTYKITTAKPGFSVRDDSYSNKSSLTNQVYLIIELPITERMSLSFRPYVQLPTTAFDFYRTAVHLNTESGVNIGQFQNRVTTYGIKIIFFNGEKNYDTE